MSTLSAFADELTKRLTEARDKHVAELASGNCRDYAAYMHLTGRIRALDFANETIPQVIDDLTRGK